MPDRALHPRRAARAASVVVGAVLVGSLAACGGGDQGTQHAANPAANAPRRQATVQDPTAQAPMERGTPARDQAIAEHIKRSVAENPALCSRVENVTILAQNGVVTLRGPVSSKREREAIVDAAELTPGVRRVDDQLDLKD